MYVSNDTKGEGGTSPVTPLDDIRRVLAQDQYDIAYRLDALGYAILDKLFQGRACTG